MDLYHYVCLYRPPSFASLPAGWELVEKPRQTPHNFERRTDLPVSPFPFGVVGFQRELTAMECEQYQLRRA